MNLASIIRSLRTQLFASLLVGGLAGWFSIITQDGAINVAQSNAQFFLGLGIVLPVTMIVTARYIEPISERQTQLVVGVLGVLIGIVAYIAIATLIAGSIGGEDLNTVRIELGASIPIVQFAVVIIAQIAVAMIMPLQVEDS